MPEARPGVEPSRLGPINKCIPLLLLLLQVLSTVQLVLGASAHKRDLQTTRHALIA